MSLFRRVLVGLLVGSFVGPGYRYTWSRVSSAAFDIAKPFDTLGWGWNALGGGVGGATAAAFGQSHLPAVLVESLLGGTAGATLVDVVRSATVA